MLIVFFPYKVLQSYIVLELLPSKQWEDQMDNVQCRFIEEKLMDALTF